VQAHGTGALNIDGCRVGTDPEGGHWPGNNRDVCDNNLYGDSRKAGEHNESGRYPANVVFSEGEAARLDRRTDDTVSSGGTPDHGQGDERHEWAANVQASTGGLGDAGGVSRYFYTPKASRAERTEDGSIQNQHPTVKPIDLMEWLVTLVSAEGQIVVDPFAGSGTTCKAAKQLGRSFIGIEQSAEWCDVARARCGLTPHDPSHVRPDDAQHGLEMYTDGGGA
jgi:site-specific DNA-methyltransferase (adenine-specific)